MRKAGGGGDSNAGYHDYQQSLMTKAMQGTLPHNSHNVSRSLCCTHWNRNILSRLHEGQNAWQGDVPPLCLSYRKIPYKYGP